MELNQLKILVFLYIPNCIRLVFVQFMITQLGFVSMAVTPGAKLFITGQFDICWVSIDMQGGSHVRFGGRCVCPGYRIG